MGARQDGHPIALVSGAARGYQRPSVPGEIMNQRCEDIPRYAAGFGRATLDGIELGRPMLGWAHQRNLALEVAEPLMARAMALEDARSGARLVYAVVELCFVSGQVRRAVLDRLAASHGLREDEIMLAATHNHSGPGGFNEGAFWYDVPSLGQQESTFQAVVGAFVRAATQALTTLEPARVFVGSGPTTDDPSFITNRSWQAYNRNPGVTRVDRSTAHQATDREMTILRVDDTAGRPLGLVSWFGLHGTTIHGDHQAIRPDHKGAASRQLEAELGDGFVAIFAQGSAGDQSPNTRWSLRRLRKIGPLDDDVASRDATARIQVDAALRIRSESTEELRGPLRTALGETDFGDAPADADYTDGSGAQRTRWPQLGIGMAMGTAEGPGPLLPFKPLYDRVLGIVDPIRDAWSVLRKRERLVELGTRLRLMRFEDDLEVIFLGFVRIRARFFPTMFFPEMAWIRLRMIARDAPGPRWLPRTLPVHLACIGHVAIAGVAGEPTMVAGRRIDRSVSAATAHAGIRRVIVGGYTNDYGGYVVTPLEYSTQGYESGSTLYGPWTLSAWQTAFDRLADHLPAVTETETTPGLTPADT